MIVRYFDMGLCEAVELKWMIEDILPALNVKEYEAYGFEPCFEFFKDAENAFKENKRVSIINAAISDHNGEEKLYYSKQSKEGHSLFESKINVDKDKYETVKCVKFSDWLKENIKNIDDSINILRFNIEGAEWMMLKDLIDSGYKDKFSLFCGAGNDVVKIGEYKGRTQEYFNMLMENDIDIKSFCAIYKNTKLSIQNTLNKILNS